MRAVARGLRLALSGGATDGIGGLAAGSAATCARLGSLSPPFIAVPTLGTPLGAPAAAVRRLVSGDAASEQQQLPEGPPPRPVGRGFGFDSRFKDMPSDELLALLRRSPPSGSARAGPRKLARPRPASHAGPHDVQWVKTDTRITAPYTTDVRRDVFAVVECGSTQFKGACAIHPAAAAGGLVAASGFPAVSPAPPGRPRSASWSQKRAAGLAVCLDDTVFVHKLPGVDVDDVIDLKRVLLAGTPRHTVIGRPFVPGLTVRAAVEEHIRDAPVYIYKRRRAKGYRRFRGFRAVRCCADLRRIRRASACLRRHHCCARPHDSRALRTHVAKVVKTCAQELTSLRILAIDGLASLGVAVPEWSEETSTPLRARPTLGERVRRARKAARRQQRRAEMQAWRRREARTTQKLQPFAAMSHPILPPLQPGLAAHVPEIPAESAVGREAAAGGGPGGEGLSEAPPVPGTERDASPAKEPR